MSESCSLTSVTPNLMVRDVAATIDFYSRVLGFEAEVTVPEAAPFDWAMMRRDDVVMMFQERSSLVGEYPLLTDFQPGGGLTLFIKVSDVEALFRAVDGKAEVCTPLHDTFYGTREFAVIDCNGFILTFAGS